MSITGNPLHTSNYRRKVNHIPLYIFFPLYADVVESHLLKNEIAVILNVFLHGVNSITCLIDIFISARPWKVFHFVYPIIFGFYYAGFSLIFWGGGGVGVCYNTKTTPENHPTATVHFPDRYHSYTT